MPNIQVSFDSYAKRPGASFSGLIYGFSPIRRMGKLKPDIKTDGWLRSGHCRQTVANGVDNGGFWRTSGEYEVSGSALFQAPADDGAHRRTLAGWASGAVGRGFKSLRARQRSRGSEPGTWGMIREPHLLVRFSDFEPITRQRSG